MEDQKAPAVAMQGWWLMLIFLLIYWAVFHAAFDISIRINAGVNPGSSPPWYFITEHLVDGLFAIGGMILCIILGILFWNKYRTWAWMMLWMSGLWFSVKIWQALIILLKTRHPFDPVLRSTTWVDFKAFQFDPLILWGPYFIEGIIFVFILLGNKRFLPRRSS